MMLIPGTKVGAKFFTFPVTAQNPNPPIYYGRNEGTLLLASVNAGNSDGLCVGLGGVNGRFLAELQLTQKNANLNQCVAGSKDDYQDRHQKLLAKAQAAGGVAYESYQNIDPCAFSYANTSQVNNVAGWHDGVCFVDVFDATLCPTGNQKNRAMLYIAPPYGAGSNYSTNAAFLKAIEATAVNIIKTIAGYNAIAAQQNLPLIQALRNTLYSSGFYCKPGVGPDEIARAIFAGFQAELSRCTDCGLVELQFPVGDSSKPLFGVVQADLSTTPAHHHQAQAFAVPAAVMPLGPVVGEPVAGEEPAWGERPKSFDLPISPEPEVTGWAKVLQYQGKSAVAEASSRQTSGAIELQLLEIGQPLALTADVVEAPEVNVACLPGRGAAPVQAPAGGNAGAGNAPVGGIYGALPQPVQIVYGRLLPNATMGQAIGATIAIIASILIVLGGVSTLVWAFASGPLRRKSSLKITPPDSVPLSAMDQAVAVTATVTADSDSTPADGGTVTCTLTTATGVVVGSAVTLDVKAGAASGSLTVPANTAAGTYTLTGVYGGSTFGLGPSEDTESLIVTTPTTAGLTTTTTITAPAVASVIVAGSTLPVTATVMAGSASAGGGTVSFSLTRATTPPVTYMSKSVPLTAGQAASGSITIPANATGGSYTLAAKYTGATGFNASTSASEMVSVNAVTTTTITAPIAGSAIAAGLSLTVSAKVVAGDMSAVPGASTVTFTLMSSAGGTAITVSPAVNSSGEASGSIAIPSTASTGSYTLTASYDGATGYAVSSATAVTLTVTTMGTPTITLNPSSAAAVPGATVIFTAAAAGAPPVQWQVSTDQGVSFSPILNAATATLTLTGVTAAMDKNQYQAVFGSGSSAAVTTAAMLSVRNVVHLGKDSAAQGQWSNVYGKDGHAIAGIATIANPAYATVAVPSQTFAYQNDTSTNPDPRSLQDGLNSSSRIGFTYQPAPATTSFSVTLTVTDAVAHQVALYLVDWEANTSRLETIVFSDPLTKKVLDTQVLANFHSGLYALWNFVGSVTITLTEAGDQPVLFGIFLDPASLDPGFHASATPAGVTAGVDSTVISTITVTSLNGFSAPVQFSASTWPAGITGTFATDSATGRTTVTISVASTVAQGSYLLTVTGTSGTLNPTTTILLFVNAPMPMAGHALIAADLTHGQYAAVNVFARGTSAFPIDPKSLVLTGLQDLGLSTAGPIAILAKDGRSLQVDGEGIWLVGDKGLIGFMADSGLTHPPTPAVFRFSDSKGNVSNPAMIIADPALTAISTIPQELAKQTDAYFWTSFKKNMIDDPNPAFDPQTFATANVTLAQALWVVVAPGPNPISQVVFDAAYKQWNLGSATWIDPSQGWQAMLDLSENVIGVLIPASAPALVARYWRLVLMSHMTLEMIRRA